jgi:hypothetical protein
MTNTKQQGSFAHMCVIFAEFSNEFNSQLQNAKFNIYTIQKIFQNQTCRKYNKNVSHVQCGYTMHGTESLHAFWEFTCMHGLYMARNAGQSAK